MQPSIIHINNNHFFNRYCKQEVATLYEKFGNTKETPLFTYKQYDLDNAYTACAFYIINCQKTIKSDKLHNLQQEIPVILRYSNELTGGMTGLIFQTEDYMNTVDIIKTISKLDNDMAEKILKVYHKMGADSVEAQEYGDTILNMQKVISKHLQENELYKQTVEIDYDLNDSQSVTKWFRSVNKEDFKVLPAYNDSDYIPFLIKDKEGKEYYVLEDCGSDELFIYNSVNESSGAWYCVDRNNFNDSDDNMHDALFESNQYIIKSIEENLDNFTLIAQYENNSLIKATGGIENLNNLQTYIYSQMDILNKPSLGLEDTNHDNGINIVSIPDDEIVIERRNDTGKVVRIK